MLCEAIPEEPGHERTEKKNRKRGLSEKARYLLYYQRGECGQGLVHSGATAEEWIGAKRRPLTAEGRQPLKTAWMRSSEMQQPQLIGYADIGEVRAETRVAVCNQLLAEGWVLLGVYPLTTVADMTPREAGEEQRKQDDQRYVRRFVGYVVGKRRGL
jgi:hypothetical protein